MTNKQIIIDSVDVSNFCLVCYYDNKTNELVHIEQYNDNDSSIYSDIDSYRYGYNAEITKPEEIIKQLKAKEQECEKLKQRLHQCWNVENSFVKQIDQLKGKNGELKKINNHIEHNRNQKADKLMRIEKLITACLTGYTDEFIQELLVILHEPEPNSFENKYKATLTEIKEIAEEQIPYLDIDKPKTMIEIEYDYAGKIYILEQRMCKILQKISEVENGNI